MLCCELVVVSSLSLMLMVPVSTLGILKRCLGASDRRFLSVMLRVMKVVVRVSSIACEVSTRVN